MTTIRTWVVIVAVLAVGNATRKDGHNLSDEDRTLLYKISHQFAVPGRLQGNIEKWIRRNGLNLDWSTEDEVAKGLQAQLANHPREQKEDPSKCMLDMYTMLMAEAQEIEFAQTMRDSDGKPMAGVRDGAFRWIGSYDQCVRTKASYAEFVVDNTTLIHDFNGRYCGVLSSLTFTGGLLAQEGYCVPDSCSSEVITEITRPDIPVPGVEFVGASCVEDTKSLLDDGHALACTIVLSAFGALVLLATFVDYGLQKRLTSTGKDEELSDKGHQNGGFVDGKNKPETITKHVTSNGDSNAVNGTPTVQPLQMAESSEVSSKPNKCVQALLAFSLYATIPRVTSTSMPRGSFTCMNGVRFLSMSWIILGHTWQLGNYITPVPLYTAENFYSQFIYTRRFSDRALTDMNLGVESFFLLSSSLVTISFMKALQRQNHRLKCRQMALYYFHRYWRLTPVYMIVLFMVTSFFDFWARGPSVLTKFPESFNCRTSWWTNMIYLNNLIHTDKMCMGWTWYLANDFQFYVIAPLFIFLMYKWPKVGGPFLALGFAGSVASAGYLKRLSSLRLHDDYKDYYIKPWSRFATYAIGMALGWIMFKTKCKVKMHWALALLGWILGGFCLMIAVYGAYDRGVFCDDCRTWSYHVDAMFYTLQRPLFAVGVCWLIFACCSGYGGFINTFLSWKGFVPLSKLTYVGYLIHPAMIYFVYYDSKRLIYVDEMTMIIYYGAMLLYTCACTFAITLVFEVPMLLLENIFIPRKH